MRKLPLIASVTTLALLLGGCSFFSFLPWVSETEEEPGGEIVTTPPETPTPTPTTPSDEGSATPPDESQSEGFPTPVEPGTPRASTAPGLITPTNPEERIRQLETGIGRPDPFGVVPVPPKITIPEDAQTGATPPREVPQVAPIPRPQPPQTQADQGTPAPSPRTPSPQPERVATTPNQAPSREPTGTNGTQAPSREPTGTNGTQAPSRQPNQPPAGIPGEGQTALTPEFTPQLPALPDPDLANGILVSGVIQIGNQPQAIIQAPNETSSRYVRPGQYVSNGQVLVKRIEMNGNAMPVVIFEQYGIEVAKSVGEGSEQPADAEEGTGTTAMVESGNRKGV